LEPTLKELHARLVLSVSTECPLVVHVGQAATHLKTVLLIAYLVILVLIKTALHKKYANLVHTEPIQETLDLLNVIHALLELWLMEHLVNFFA